MIPNVPSVDRVWVFGGWHAVLGVNQRPSRCGHMNSSAPQGPAGPVLVCFSSDTSETTLKRLQEPSNPVRLEGRVGGPVTNRFVAIHN